MNKYAIKIVKTTLSISIMLVLLIFYAGDVVANTLHCGLKLFEWKICKKYIITSYCVGVFANLYFIAS